ncbi:MAG TPA: Y-family DNA polymerase [Flavobacteriaceae bacterium]|nr:Y-family DNA polymerase [Flavobacteriaceae bacterium]
MYALVDGNNFYVSCERVFNPTLRNRPVVVLSNNDGCVISRSDEAKKLGISMGAPAFEYENKFKEWDVKVFSSNYSLYGDMSNRIYRILQNYTPDIEVYSIDECFLKFNHLPHISLDDYARKMRSEVLKKTLIPTCVGIAPTKALAKVANRIAKKFPQLGAVFLIDTEEKRIKALKWLEIEDVWGIGRRMSKRLKDKGIRKAIQFTELSDEYVRREFSVTGLRLKKELEGISVLKLEEIQAKKQIATTRSFDKTYADKDYLKERITTFAVNCAQKLRKQQSTCQSISVFIHSNRFDVKQERHFRSITIPYPTNSDIEIARFAQKAFSLIFKPGVYYKKAGVIVSGIAPENERQYSLFEEESVKHRDIMHVMDRLNSKYGTSKLKLASQALDKTWKMRQEHLSPNYTTKWKDILEVR